MKLFAWASSDSGKRKPRLTTNHRPERRAVRPAVTQTLTRSKAARESAIRTRTVTRGRENVRETIKENGRETRRPAQRPSERAPRNRSPSPKENHAAPARARETGVSHGVTLAARMGQSLRSLTSRPAENKRPPLAQKKPGPAKAIPPQTKGRLEIVMGMFVLAFVILSIRAADLAILQGKVLKGKADGQHKRKVEIPANRGRFLDRNGIPLAISLPVKALAVDIDRVDRDRLEYLTKQLAPLLGLPQDGLQKRLQAMKPGSFPILKRKIPPENVKKIQALNEAALYFTPEVQRFYPLGEVSAHFLGFTDIDDKGVEGLERSMEKHLHGIPGLQRITRDRMGRVMPEAQILQPAKPGSDIVLTIDATIQYIAYRALMKGVTRSHAKAGSVIVMDPRNGHILALANQPSFNPNHMSVSQADARRNRVITDSYEPGSTFKTFTVAMALDLGLISPDTMFDCSNGVFAVSNRIIRDHKPLGKCSVRLIVEQSSNIGAAKIGLMTGDARQRHYLQKFGFGHPTGIELLGEASGSMPDIHHYEQVGVANRSFGQGVSVTPIQLITGTAAAINGGLHFKPQLIARMEHDASTVMDLAVKPTQVITPRTSEIMRDLLTAVVSATGTAQKAAVAGYTVAGKTGTAQKAIKGGYSTDLFYTSFVGFVPAEKPRLVIFVGIDEPQGEHYGGQLAAPVFREIVQEVLPMLSVLPSVIQKVELPPLLPDSSATGDSLINTSLATALEKLLPKGISPKVKGSGRIIAVENDGKTLILK